MRNSNQSQLPRELPGNRRKRAPEFCHRSRHRSGIVPALFGFGFLAVWFLFLSVAAEAQCYLRPANIVAWWPGDGHAYDVINVKAAALQNGAGYAPGLVGQGFSFDGSTEKVRLGESTSIDLSRMPEWTIEAWVRPASFTNSTYPTIYSEGTRIVSLGINRGTGRLESWIDNDPGNRFVGTLSLLLNQWSHVALVFDGGDRTMYVNGVFAGSTNTIPLSADSSGAAIGHVTQNETASAFLGQIDELSLYNRALSAAEILGIANARSAGKCFGATNPAFVFQPVGQTAFLFGQATFGGLAMGSPVPTYRWLFNGSTLVGETNATLILTNIGFSREGNYALVAMNSSGSVTSAPPAHLTVKPCADTPSGVVGWWPGDGSALDVTGNHHGTAWGEVTYPKGSVGPCMGLNGTDAYVAVCDSPALSPHVGAHGEMTLEAWVYLTQYPQTDPGTGQNRRAVMAKGDAGRWEYELSISTTGVPEFFVFNASGSAYASIASGQILLNTWHHLVGTVEKGQFIRLYQDGALMNESATLTGDTVDGDTPLYIGRRSDGQFLNGLVDEAALYQRALAADDVAALYAGGSVGKCFGTHPAPVFAVPPADKAGWEGNDITLEALALGTPRPNYQWKFWGTNLPGATNAILLLTNLNPPQAGPYTLVASNLVGSTLSRTATLTVTDFFSEMETFEAGGSGCGWRGWTTDNYALWQMGVPTSGPGSAHSGQNVAATVLDGYYPPYSSSRLISPVTKLPAIGPGEMLQLRFWHWFNYSSYDYGSVRLLVQNPTNGVWSETDDLTSVSGYSVVWTPDHVDLTPYAGQRVRLVFYHYATRCAYCGATEAEGWYIDDVELWKGAPQSRNSEGFERGWGDWYTDQGTWEIGTPTSGPGQARSGSGVAATVLSGDYYAWGGSRLVSPMMTLPAVAAGEEVQLRFWHWFNYSSYDYGSVRLFVQNPTNGVWSETGDLTSVSGYSVVWTPDHVDLTPYAGQRVRLVFYHYATRCAYCGATEAQGWYVDDIEIWKGVPQSRNPEGFELGWGDWYTDQGTWEVGPGFSHSGSNGAATVLSGDYYAWGSSRLISPPMDLPGLSPGEEFQLCYQEWYSYGAYDSGTVQLSVYNPESGQYGNWLDLRTVSGSSGGWLLSAVPLSSYAGQRVRFAFYHNATRCAYCGASEGDGWYLDDVYLKRGNIAIAAIPDKTIAEANTLGVPSTLTFQVQLIGADPGACLSFSLPWAPPGAAINPETGVFKWTPSECQGPGDYSIPIYVVDYCNGEANDLGVVQVMVNEVNEPPWLMAQTNSVDVLQTNQIPLACWGDPDCPRNSFRFTLLPGAPLGASLDNNGIFRWVPTLAQLRPEPYVMQVELCDDGAPNYCVTSTLSVTVTTNCLFSIRHRTGNELEFTILRGRTDCDYVLQHSATVCSCPCATPWQPVTIGPNVLRVSPTRFPWSFTLQSDYPRMFFRLKEEPKK